MNVKKDLNYLFQQYLNDCAYLSKLKPETVRGYENTFKLFMTLMPTAKLEYLTDGYVSEFFARLSNRQRIVGRGEIRKDVKRSTAATYRSKLNNFFKWLEKKGHIKRNPFYGVPYPRVDYIDRKFLKKEEVDAIFLAVNHTIKWENNFVKKRNIAIFSSLLYTGVRKGELLGLRIFDVDLTRNLLLINATTSKSGIDRYVPMTDQLVLVMKDYLAELEKHNLKHSNLFISSTSNTPLTSAGLKHLVSKVIEESGVDFHLHRFRHTFAVNLLKQGYDVAVLKQLMGHRDIRMTASYLRCLPSDITSANINKLTLANLV